MGSKVNPNGLRYGINKEWQSRWIANSHLQTAQWIVQDDKIRTHFFSKYKNAKIDHIEIERDQSSISIFVYCVLPGVIFGTENSELKNATLAVNKIVGRSIKVKLNIFAIESPDLSARIIAREIANAIENRVSFRNAQKMAIKKVLWAGAKGVKTHVSGRLGGVEMAREEGYSEGIITLSTLRTDIDYALEEAHTTYGIIGVKVWINRGEIFKKGEKSVTRVANRTNNSRSSKNQSAKGSTRKSVNRAPVANKEDAANKDAPVNN